MSFKVNIAVQIVPMTDKVTAYKIIDEAIAVVRRSGIRFRVCPFETVLEGDYEQLMQIVAEMQEVSQRAGAKEFLVNLKIHRAADRDVTMEEKTEKYT